MQEQIEERKKKTGALIIMIVTLVVSIIGATYAYFMIAPTANNVIKGDAATADMTLVINKLFPSTEGWSASNQVMIPQLESTLSDAMGEGYYCVDEYGNVICQVYEMIVTNIGTSQIVVDGTITYTGTTNMPNLKWRFYGSSTQLSTSDVVTQLSAVSTNSITEDASVTFADDLTLKMLGSSGSIQYYYLVLWINAVVDENGNEGVQTDQGVYEATVEFLSSNGIGVTSTFRS